MDEARFNTPGPHVHWKDLLSSCECWKDPLAEIESLTAKIAVAEEALDSARNGLNCALEAIGMSVIPTAFQTCFDDSLKLVEETLIKIRGEA